MAYPAQRRASAPYTPTGEAGYLEYDQLTNFPCRNVLVFVNFLKNFKKSEQLYYIITYNFVKKKSGFGF